VKQSRQNRKKKFEKAFLLTLGCAKNEVDSEVLAGILSRMGIEIVDNAEETDVIVINTCGFITAAKQESINSILEAVEIKKADPQKTIIVWGCLSERYENDLKKGIPEVDAWFGVENFKLLGAFFGSGAADESVQVCENRHRFGPSHTAYLKIADGCNHNCTFCAIPGIKGKLKSRSIQSLLREARLLAESGVKELILIAQDTSSYGRDLGRENNLCSLLRELLEIERFQWIRIMYVHPDRVTDELIDLIAAESRICNYIDIPLQHIANPILKKMGRQTSQEQIISLLRKLRSRIPDIVIRTTFIVGFPGETDEMFEELISFIQQTKFDRAGAFIYSPEDGTPAADFIPAVDEAVAQQRLDVFMTEQQLVSESLNEAAIGQMVKILIDGRDESEGLLYGRTAGDAPEIDQTVWVKASLPAGEFADVVITEYSEYDLVGRIKNGGDVDGKI